MLSSGGKKDLLVLSFCKAILDVSKMREVKQDQDLLHLNNNSHKMNKKIFGELDILGVKVSQTIHDIYSFYGTDVAQWVRKNLEKRIGKMLTDLQSKKVNLEMLALWVLYVNFSDDQERVLIDQFIWLQDADQYFKILTLMERTSVATVEAEMFQVAYDVVSKIKG